MKNRIFASLALMMALVVPGLSAQNRRNDRADQGRPPEADVLVGAVRAISRMHMEEFSDSVLWEAAIRGMINELDDPYAELFTPAESDAWEEQTTGNYSGIGLQISLLNEEVTVTGVFRGFPASEAGIAVGDVIVGVNSTDVTNWNTQTAADSIRGPAGTEVRVRVKRAGYDEPLAFDIKRAEVHVPALEWGKLEDGIGYVHMDRVARNAAQEMSNALDELSDANGLILDLRGNPGGFLDESLMLADLFLKPGSRLASTVQRVPGGPVTQPETDEYADRWPQRVPDLPVILLVDGYTASGAEILAGALQDYDRALVLGERTFGKGLVQTVMELPHGRRLRFTTGTWLTPLGRSLQRARDSQGRPLPEENTDYPKIATASGRMLVNGGGIFPDLEIKEDTLTLAEQNLVEKANELEFPLPLRLTEFAFQVASARRADDEPPDVHDDEFADFIASLTEQGLPAELLADPAVEHYLRWQAHIAVADKMDDLATETTVRAERDPVLTEAIRLLTTTHTQAGLFEAVSATTTAARDGVTR